MKKLCVFFGGNSVEHDISIITAFQLCKNIEQFYDVEKIYIGLDNKFYLATGIKDISYFSNKKEVKLQEILISGTKLYKKKLLLKEYCEIKCAINCCHGGIGENGVLAGFFEANGIVFTSASSLSSAVAMNKNLTKKLVKEIVPVVNGIEITKNNFAKGIEEVKNKLKNDLIVKPNSLGSSIGVKVCNKTDFVRQVNTIFELNDTALVEERVVDLVEYNQACFIDDGKLVVSEIEQPLTKSNYLTFEDKYQHNTKQKGKDRLIPAPIGKRLQNKISSITKQIYSLLNMSGVVRIDYIFDKSTSTLYFNEINTIPGSMAYYLFEPLGIDYITLVEKLIENAETQKEYSYIQTDVLENKKI